MKIVSVHVLYFSFFSFFSFCSLFRFFSSFSLGQSGYVKLCWRDGTWSSTIYFRERGFFDNSGELEVFIRKIFENTVTCTGNPKLASSNSAVKVL